jgi:tetratricopeptide (TPR) repeat protein
VPASAEELYNEGWLAHKAGSFRDAILFLERSLALKEHFKARELMGVCLKESGDIQGALLNFELAYKLNEKSSKTGCLLADILLETGRVNQAKEVVDQVLLNHPGYGPAVRLRNAFHNHNQ